jgi:hypothetical protein
MEKSKRGALLTVVAVLYTLLAVSDFLKPFTENDRTGIVIFGFRQHGLADAILGPLLGAVLLAYATGILLMRRFAVPLAWAYAAFVIVNMILFRIFNPPKTQNEMVFGFGFMILAIAITVGSALILTRRRPELI